MKLCPLRNAFEMQFIKVGVTFKPVDVVSCLLLQSIYLFKYFQISPSPDFYGRSACLVSINQNAYQLFDWFLQILYKVKSKHKICEFSYKLFFFNLSSNKVLFYTNLTVAMNKWKKTYQKRVQNIDCDDFFSSKILIKWKIVQK